MTRVRVVACFATVCLAVLGVAARLSAHPLHTTLSELTVDSATHVVRVTVRLFADILNE